MLFLVLQCIENYETFSQKPRLDDDAGVDFYTTSLITVPSDDPEDEEWEDVESESDSMEDESDEESEEDGIQDVEKVGTQLRPLHQGKMGRWVKGPQSFLLTAKSLNLSGLWTSELVMW